MHQQMSCALVLMNHPKACDRTCAPFQDDQDKAKAGARAAGTTSVIGLTAAVTINTPVGALLGSSVATHSGDPKVCSLSQLHTMASHFIKTTFDAASRCLDRTCLMSDPLPICCFGAYHAQVEELRLVLLNSVSAVGQLARVLQQGDDWLRIVAASALGNLAACRADVKDVRPQVWQSAVHWCV